MESEEVEKISTYQLKQPLNGSQMFRRIRSSSAAGISSCLGKNLIGEPISIVHAKIGERTIRNGSERFARRNRCADMAPYCNPLWAK